MNTMLKQNPKIVQAVSISALLIVAIWAASVYLPPGRDWGGGFRRASLAMLSGGSPYESGTFFHTPWSLIPLLPFAILPERIGRGALFVVGLMAFAYTAYRLGAKPLGLVAFLVSPPVIHCLLNANIEWIPLLGFVLPPQIGLILVMTKPQTGFVVALFWIVEAWQRGGFREVLRISWPFFLTVLLSLILFGLWPLRLLGVFSFAGDFNASLWPYSIPVGLALLVASLRRHQIRYAVGASPFLAPYILFHGWSAAVVALAGATAELIAAVIGLWILVAIRALGGGL